MLMGELKSLVGGRIIHGFVRGVLPAMYIFGEMFACRCETGGGFLLLHAWLWRLASCFLRDIVRSRKTCWHRGAAGWLHASYTTWSGHRKIAGIGRHLPRAWWPGNVLPCRAESSLSQSKVISPSPARPVQESDLYRNRFVVWGIETASEDENFLSFSQQSICSACLSSRLMALFVCFGFLLLLIPQKGLASLGCLRTRLKPRGNIA